MIKTESYSTLKIKNHRNMVILMILSPLATLFLVVIVLVSTNRSNGTDAQAVCTRTISSGSLASAANLMSAGQTLCLHGSASFSGGTINRGVKVITTPGQTTRAKVIGYLGLAGNGITMENLYINGSGDIRSPFITGDNITLRNNEVLNVGATRGICILIGPSDGSIRPRNTVIDRNRIHNCGTVTHDQGIYMAHSIGARVTNNYIYDNPDFGIQFYPSAQDSIVEYNVFDNNAQGITYSSESGFSIASRNNIVRNNIITNSFRRYNAEYYWGGSVGSGNQFINNCVFNGKSGNIQPGLASYVNVNGTINSDPMYVNRGAKDFRLKAGSPCVGKGPQSTASSPPAIPSPNSNPPTTPPSTQPIPGSIPAQPLTETKPILVPGSGTEFPVKIPIDLPIGQDGTITADFTGDGANEVVKDVNNNGHIDPKTEIWIDSNGTLRAAAYTYPDHLLGEYPEINSTTVKIKLGLFPEVKLPKPIAYTFMTAGGLTLSGIGTYMAATKLALFGGLRGKWGL